MKYIRCVVLFVFPVLIVIGCGGSGIPMAEVEGTVKVNGKGVDGIHVEFWPVGQGVRSIGQTDAEGRYKLKTDDGKHDGASVGSHKIILKDVGIMGDFEVGRAAEDLPIGKGKKPRVSAIYSNPETSTLKKDVVAGQKNVLDLDAEPFK